MKSHAKIGIRIKNKIRCNRDEREYLGKKLYKVLDGNLVFIKLWLPKGHLSPSSTFCGFLFCLKRNRAGFQGLPVDKNSLYDKRTGRVADDDRFHSFRDQINCWLCHPLHPALHSDSEYQPMDGKRRFCSLTTFKSIASPVSPDICLRTAMEMMG